MIDIVSAIFLLLTGVVALVVGVLLLKEYLAKKTMHHLWWSIAFLVLFASGVHIILRGFEVLNSPLIPPIAALIPVGLAVGLLFVMYENDKIAWGFLGYEGIMILITLIMGLIDGETNSVLIMAIHVPAGLAIFFLPFMSGEDKAYMFSIGGALISVGGMLLAMMKLTTSDFVLFQADFIFAVLPPLLLIVGAFFTLAVIYPEKWRIEVPVLSGMLLKEATAE